jgi:hypothetical protein
MADFADDMCAIADRGRYLDLFDTGIGYGYTRRKLQEQRARFERHLAEEVCACHRNGFRKLVTSNSHIPANVRYRLIVVWLEFTYSSTPLNLRRFTQTEEFIERIARTLRDEVNQPQSPTREGIAEPNNEPPELATVLAHPASPTTRHKNWQRIEQFLQSMNAHRPPEIKAEAQKVDMWRIAEYTEPSTFNKYQSGKVPSPKIDRVLKMTAEQFWTACKKIRSAQNV